jgi:ADP-ribose pyrophosphatase
MTNANMKLIVLNVTLPDRLEMPGQKLEAGEFIVRRVVQLSKLSDALKGT